MTKAEVCAYLGKSPRTIASYAADGRLPAHYIHGPNGREVRFARADVERMKRDNETPVVRPVPNGGESTALARTNVVHRADDPFDLAYIFQRAAEYAKPAPRLWLTLDEAADYSGHTRAWLLSEARSGNPFARDESMGGTNSIWRFSREGLAK